MTHPKSAVQWNELNSHSAGGTGGSGGICSNLEIRGLIAARHERTDLFALRQVGG